MKILHTADWHLGQKFISREREDEHRMALDWLANTIAEEKIDLLLIAGDVFDISHPPNYAQALYYNFFKKLRFSQCRHVVVIGGNHDSAQMLEAPKELLQLLDIHVVGAVTDNVQDEIIEIKNKDGQLEMVIAAVPFLRDQDLRRAVSGESGMERIQRIQEGIVAHYQTVGEAMEIYRDKKVPLIVTGHLYAKGAVASEKQDNIYLGNLENIRSDQFPDVFDYVALGHIHRAQAVGGNEKIRYSGSLLPLSFSETKDDKVVACVEFSEDKILEIKELPVPLFRRLKSIEGRLSEVQDRLTDLHQKYKDHLPAWVEVMVETDQVIPNLDGLLHDFTREMNIELLRVRLKKEHLSLDAQVETAQLEDLSPLDVFRKKCESAGRPPEQMEELEQTFRELQEWMTERRG